MKKLLLLIVFSIISYTCIAGEGLQHEAGLTLGSAYLNYKATAYPDIGIFYNVILPKFDEIHFGVSFDRGIGKLNYLISMLNLYFKFGENFKFGTSAGYYSETENSDNWSYSTTIRYYGAFFRASFNFLIPVGKLTISPVLNFDLFRREYLSSICVNVSYPLPK